MQSNEPPGNPSWLRSYRWVLVALALGLAIRVPLLIAAQSDGVPGDQLQYSAQARVNASGDWFQQPFEPRKPAAEHPPLTSAVLTPITWLTKDSNFILAQRLTVMAFGMANIVLFYALGRQFSAAVANVAALIGALDAHIFLNDSLLFSETFGVTLITLLLLAALRLTNNQRSGPRQVLTIGTLLGLLLYTRAEFLLLVPLLCIWMWWIQPVRTTLRSIVRASVPGVVALVIVSPWVLWNAVRFEERVVLSTNDGLTLLGSNCDNTYYGENIGGYSFICALSVSGSATDDASQVAAAQRAAATEYVRGHVRRVPLVVAARAIRQWELGWIGTFQRDGPREGRAAALVLFGSAQWWVLGALAFHGAWRLCRRVLWLFMLAPIVVTIAAMAVTPQWRIRVVAEPAVIVLAALGIVRLRQSRVVAPA